MTLIDKRAIPLTVTFGDIAIGDAFQDHDGDIHIKTDLCATMYWDERLQVWQGYHSMHENDLVIPLQITYTIEREKK